MIFSPLFKLGKVQTDCCFVNSLLHMNSAHLPPPNQSVEQINPIISNDYLVPTISYRALGKTALGFLYRLIIYTSLITGFQSIACTLTSQLVLGFKPDLILLAIVFTLTTFLYGCDRLNGTDTDSKSDARTLWIIKHQTGLKILVILSGSLGIFLTAFRPRVTPLLTIMLCLALIYTAPWLPGRRSFKHLPGVKTVFVSAIWAGGCVGLPVIVSGVGWQLRELLMSSVLFLLMCTISSINDLFDIEQDRKNGIRSLPVLWGEARVHQFGGAMSLIVALIAVVGLGSPGLALAGVYHAAYAILVRGSYGRDYWSNTLMYRASSFVMLLLVVLLK